MQALIYVTISEPGAGIWMLTPLKSRSPEAFFNYKMFGCTFGLLFKHKDMESISRDIARIL